MHTHTTTYVRRYLSRGLATGLLFTQSALMSFAQAAPAATDAQVAADKAKKDAAATEQVVVLEKFTVRAGFSGSLAAAADMKQKQTLITDVVAAEDIGKLPDISIAESLTRLPGVTTQRLNGRAQAIVIRGLNGNFSTALLNGRQQVSTGAGRSVEFDQYPAELLSSVVVYKSTDASLVGQGLAGTVDLQTVRPLNSSTRTLAANAFYEWNSLGAINAGAKASGNRETLSYVDQFMDGKLGIAIGYSHSDRPGQGYQWNAWGYPDVGGGSPVVLGGAKPFVRTSEIIRDGTMAVLEFKPSENLHSTIDLYYSDFQETQLLRGIEIPLWWSSAQLQPGYTVSNGLVTAGTFKNVYGVVRNDYVKRDDHLFAGGWNLEMGNKDSWKTDLDLSYSHVGRRDLVLETYSGYASNQSGTPETLGFNMGSGDGGATFTHLLDYSDGTKMRLQNPQGWSGDQFPGGQAGFVKGPYSEDKISQYMIKTQHAMQKFFSRFEAGLAQNTRDKYEYDLGPDGTEGYFLGFKNGATSAPLPASVGTTDLSFIGMGKEYSYDPLALYNSGFYEKKPNLNPALRANNFDVSEKITMAYFKFDIDSKMGNTPVTGNIGTQYIHSQQDSNGLSVGPSIVPVNRGHKYNDWVPALNLNFGLSDKTTLRFAAARQLARQPMSDMRAGSTYGYNVNLANSTDPLNGPWSGGGGNPNLEPWRSNSYDLSLEHYFKDRMGYWAVAAFDKELVSYTYNKTSIISYAGFPTGVAAGQPGAVPKITTGRYDSPDNGQGGYIRGLEFALSLPGEKFTPALKGFGFVGSVSFFKSSIQPDLGNPSQPLPGLSDRVATSTFYYEAKSGFAARISARYRSDYRGDISTFGPRGVNYRNLQAETNIDAQISYSFNKGMLKGMTLIAQGYNLNDEPLFASDGPDTRRVQDYQRYGASYSIGATYKF
ncbi:MAG: TonB-dependent receptor [Opitutae bacterium]